MENEKKYIFDKSKNIKRTLPAITITIKTSLEKSTGGLML